MAQNTTSIIVDKDALAHAKNGTLEQLLWFAWYTLRDNSPNKEHRFQIQVAKDLIDATHAYNINAPEIGRWNERDCILILDELRKRKKMPWLEYDIYQKHFWHLLNIITLCDLIDANPLDSWIYNDNAKALYRWQAV